MYDIKVYRYTGFDNINIPDSPATLENSTIDTRVYPNINIVQDKQLARVQLLETWDYAQDIDYVRVGDTTYYYCNSVTMVSSNCVSLSLTLAGVLTSMAQGATWHASAARLSQRNKADFNYLEEAWSNPSPLQDIDTVHIDSNTKPSYYLIGLTVNPDSTNAIAKEYQTNEGSGVLYVPQVEPPAHTTTLTAYGTTYTLPGESLYNGKAKSVKDGVATIVSLGLESSILHRYSLPLRYSKADWSDDVNTINSIEGVNETIKGAKCDHSGIYVPNNTKANVLYAKEVVYSDSSGDANEYDFGLITYDGNIPNFTLEADPSPEGMPILRPQYYNKRLTVGTEQAVRGSKWYTPLMAINSPSGIRQKLYNTRRADTVANYKEGLGIVNRIIQGAAALKSGDVSGVIGAVTGGATDVINTAVERNDRASELHQAQNVYTPTLMASNGEASQLTLGNGFKIIGQNLTIEDMKLFDKYLTKFGQAVASINITSDDVKNIGSHFCYVEAGSVAFTSQTPRYIREAAMEELNNGVRIWHEKPDFNVYERGNI